MRLTSAGIEQRGGRHHLRVVQRQVVGVLEVGDRFRVVPALELERHDQLVAPLGDVDVVVLALDMGEAAVLALEDLGAHAFVDQRVVGGRRGRAARTAIAISSAAAAAPALRSKRPSRQQDQAAGDAGGAEPQRDRARADGRDQVEGGAERADDRAEGRDAVDRARDHAGALRRAQHQPDRERRIHAEEGHRKQQDRQRGDQAAGAHVVDVGEQELEQRLRERGQHQHVERGHQHGDGEHAERGGAVGEPAAEEIAERQRHQHGRDQRRPGIDAAAEIGVEIARPEHLEAHHDGAGHEGDAVDQDAWSAVAEDLVADESPARGIVASADGWVTTASCGNTRMGTHERAVYSASPALSP